jgi:hypothetical protein
MARKSRLSPTKWAYLVLDSADARSDVPVLRASAKRMYDAGCLAMMDTGDSTYEYYCTHSDYPDIMEARRMFRLDPRPWDQ